MSMGGVRFREDSKRGAVAVHGAVAVGITLVLTPVAVAAMGARDELLGLLFLAAVTPLLWRVDVAEHRLPNAVVLPGMVVAALGVTCGALRTGESPALAVFSAGAVGVFLMVMSVAGGLGMGDVKLGLVLALCAGTVGASAAVAWLAIAFILAGVASLGVLLVRGTAGRIAFGPFMLTGFWASVALSAAGGFDALIG